MSETVCVYSFFSLFWLSVVVIGITDKGGFALSEALKANSSLKHLDLSFLNTLFSLLLFTLFLFRNSITDKGGSAFLEAVKVNSAITSICLLGIVMIIDICNRVF